MTTKHRYQYEFGTTFEEVPFAGQLLSVELEVRFDVQPYDKGDWTTPPYGGGIDDWEIEVTGVFNEDMQAPAWDRPEVMEELTKFIEQKYAKEIVKECEAYDPSDPY